MWNKEPTKSRGDHIVKKLQNLIIWVAKLQKEKNIPEVQIQDPQRKTLLITQNLAKEFRKQFLKLHIWVDAKLQQKRQKKNRDYGLSKSGVIGE